MAMHWLRKNNKKILAIIGILLMVGFLIPNLSRRDVNSRKDDIFGYYTDNKGEKAKISVSKFREYDNFLRILRAFGMHEISQGGIISQVPSLGITMGQFPVLTTHQLFFGDSYFSPQFRNALYQQARQGSWASTRQEHEQLRREIDQLTSSETNLAPLYFFLLAQESRRGGFQATDNQIDDIIKVREQIRRTNKLARPDLSQIIKQFGISMKYLKFAIGEYLSVIQYAHSITKSLTLSESQLKAEVRDAVGRETITGKYVTFEAQKYLDQVEAPAEEELEKQFQKYKQFPAGDVNDENLHGFGYQLPDRVRIEYLKIDLVKAKELAIEEFNKQNISLREKQIQEYWKENKDKFRTRVPKPQSGENPDTEPEYEFKDPPFTEVADKAKDMLIKDNAHNKAKQMLIEAKRESEKNRSVSEKKPTDDAGSAADHCSYQKLARQFSTDRLPITYGQSQFLSPDEAQADPDIGNVYKVRNELPQQSLLAIIFNCEPLREDQDIKFQNQVVRLYEDIPSLMAVSGRDFNAAYMVRVIDVDKKRAAQGLNDDGRSGPPTEKSEPNKASTLREKVSEDVKMLKAYQLAQDMARDFVQKAKVDWTPTLEQFRKNLVSDPNQPTFGILPEETLEGLRDRIKRLSESMQKNPRLASYFQSQVARMSFLLDKSLQRLWQDDQAEPDKLTVLDLDEDYNCLVFKDLKATLPSQEEYLRRRPVIAQQYLANNQGLMCIVHFNPANIVKRNNFTKGTESEELAEKK